MLKAKQVPDEALTVALHEYVGSEKAIGPAMRDAIAAAINAWPGMETRTRGYDGKPYPRIILPLPQEAGE